MCSDFSLSLHVQMPLWLEGPSVWPVCDFPRLCVRKLHRALAVCVRCQLGRTAVWQRSEKETEKRHKNMDVLTWDFKLVCFDLILFPNIAVLWIRLLNLQCLGSQWHFWSTNFITNSISQSCKMCSFQMHFFPLGYLDLFNNSKAQKCNFTFC